VYQHSDNKYYLLYHGSYRSYNLWVTDRSNGELGSQCSHYQRYANSVRDLQLYSSINGRLRHCINEWDNYGHTDEHSWSRLLDTDIVYQYRVNTNNTYDDRGDRHRYTSELTNRGISIMGIECNFDQWYTFSEWYI